jgi:hypothetical protein
MNLKIDAELARQAVINFLRNMALEALITSPDREEITVGFGFGPSNACTCSRDRLARHIAVYRPNIVQAALEALNEEKALDGHSLWQGEYRPSHREVKFRKLRSS